MKKLFLLFLSTMIGFCLAQETISTSKGAWFEYCINGGESIGPDPGSTMMSLSVPTDPRIIGTGVGELSIAEVSFSIQHYWASDLEVVLISPNGTEMALTTDNGGSDGLDSWDPMAFMIFKDDSANDVNLWSGGIPLADYRPEGGSTIHPIEDTQNGTGANMNEIFAGQPTSGAWKLRVYDDSFEDDGYMDKFCLRFAENILNVSDETENSIAVYPNPADVYLNLKNLTNASFTEANVYDVQGNLVLKFSLKSAKNDERFDISSLTSGIYFIKISNETKSIVQKFIKR